MAQGAQPRCKYYFERPASIPQVGGPPIQFNVPLCEILVSLHGAGTIQARMRKLQICDEMARAGGDSIESTKCAFAGQPPCPYYAV
jgi:hypothetical protein